MSKNVITKVNLSIEHRPDSQDHLVVLQASQGEQAILTSFTYQHFGEFSQKLLEQGFLQLAEVIANPPEIDLPPEPEPPAMDATKSSAKVVAGPYHLEQGGKRRKVTMFDPFDIQETYMKNKDLRFETLAEAKTVALALVDNDQQAIRVLGKGKKEAAVINMTRDEILSDEEVITDADD
ncbi:MAG: hypothetical protein WBC91_19780 [Phototrophicaceae bacterium]